MPNMLTAPVRPWGKLDIARLRRAVERYPTHTAAAEALGISKTALSRYRDGLQKPAGKLALSALRGGIERILACGIADEDS